MAENSADFKKESNDALKKNTRELRKSNVQRGRIPIFPVMPPALDYACLPFVSSSSNALLYKMIVA